MANLGKIISEKIAADSQWREQRQMERDSITSTQGAGLVQITSDPASYARYLNMQADNFTYSPGNIALVMEQMPTATVFGTQERWQNLGRTVDPAELSKGASIFARSANGKGYAMTPAYDISQTTGRDIRSPQLADDSKEMEAALRILMNYSPVPVVPDQEIEAPAFYDQSNLELAINPNYPDSEAFAGIAAEIAHARFHDRGRNGDYHRGESDLDAQSVSYILCRRFGVSRGLPDLSRLPELYQDWPVESRKDILDGIQDMSKMIGNSIEKEITPQQRTIPHTRRQPRQATR